MFNSNHPAYTTELWRTLVDCVSRLKKNFQGEITGFDRSIIKRQLYHMMFLEQNENDIFETISYNDSEYLNEYTGYSELFVKFVSTGAAEYAKMSFSEFCKLPNWLADWIMDWSLKTHASKTKEMDNVEESLEKELGKMRQGSKPDPFKKNGY